MSLVESSLPRILRIPRSDEANNFALLHVSRVGSADLNLAATEGQFPYTGVVRRAYLETYRSKNYQGSDDDWTHIMLYTLGQLQDSTEKSTLLSGIEASANITNYDDENKLVISIRRRIQTITQRLGSITLRQDNEQVIELFDWTALAVTRTDILEQRLSTLQQDYRMAEDTINRLSNKLNELIDAKSRHEEQLMTNLTQLLNEKKLKIRNQQRLLITANFNTDEGDIWPITKREYGS
ncbi:hypothetical protein BO71DRAFT_395302 [Aspergillus ellipticus CBS 707.79]|uniref:Uncharacterized protein n=1 Tax=Aspergillus ellipticus CBS 707.79 TaxID=1448320 RepID=A0A319DLA6_9EURO|nr:hypothetical protein BO71DRAFT_395302 [Aspergillus ellipticus CBS 707.79]